MTLKRRLQDVVAFRFHAPVVEHSDKLLPKYLKVSGILSQARVVFAKLTDINWQSRR